MLKDEFSFELEAQDDKARLGLIKTKRGTIKTPAFMPVGTQGTVKGLFTDDILKTKADIVFILVSAENTKKVCISASKFKWKCFVEKPFGINSFNAKNL